MTEGWERGGDPLVDLTDDARAADAIAARSQERWLRAQAAESATFAGTLRDLVEAQRTVVVTTRDGRGHTGAIVALSVDHLELATPARARVLVRMAAVATVRPDPAGPAVVAQGDREAGGDRRLLERCARWAEERPEVAVAVRGGADLLRGRLTGVGEDVVTIVADGGRTPTYVAAEAIDAVARPGG